METLAYLLLGIFSFFVVLFLLKKKKLRGYAKKRIEKLWNHVDEVDHVAHKVLEADKVLHVAFQELGYKGTLGDCLKRHGSRLPNLNDVWSAHKLRNKIAHDPGIKVSEKDAARAIQSFRRAVYSFL